MKKQLQKELSAHLSLGLAFFVTAMLFSASANAQIVYHDIVHDTTVTALYATYTYNLDLNGDGTTDFLIKTARPRGRYPESPVISYTSITPQGSNAFISTTLNTVKKLVFGDAISSNQTWHDTTFQYLKQWYYQFSIPPITTNTGEWNSVVNGYIGLQLINGGQTYYGWVRMDVNVSTSSASITIKDYAYNSIPNQPILAGQTIITAIIENSFASSINLFPNPAKNHLTIALGSNNKKVEVTIADITGKVIYTTIATDTQKVEVNTKDFAEGIFVVQIQAAGFIVTKKFIIAK